MRRQGVAHALLAFRRRLDGELRHRPVDVGRQQRDLQPFQLAAEIADLVGVAHVEGHRGGEELDRIVGLEIGRLVGDQRIGRGMALVEAVARELRHLVEDHRGARLLDVVLGCAFDEVRALGIHLRLDLLAHGAAQQVGAAQRIARQDLGDLHHLLLVDHDAVGLFQDALERRMQVVGLLLTILDADIGRDVVHRAGPIERHQRDQVLEAVGLELGQDVAHAAAFHLEDPVGIALGQHLEGRFIVERDLRDVDLVAADLLDGLFDHGEGLEAEEVELHQARGLDPFHVELGGRQRFLVVGIAIERHELVERPVADHHAGSMRRGVAVEALELQRQIDQPLDLLVGAVLLLQELLALQRLRQRHRLGRVVGHQLADAVDLAVGHAQHAADVAQHGARLQLAEGDDRRHAVVAVFVAHVADHPVALVLAEVDIEVRHRHALGIEEALEQQAPAQRVEIGDLERPGDQRARPRAAAGPDRDAVVLGPLDEVGNDQEVAREAHLLDHVELVGEPVLVGLELDVGRQPVAAFAARRGRSRPFPSAHPSRRGRQAWCSAAGSACAAPACRRSAGRSPGYCRKPPAGRRRARASGRPT